MLKSLDTVRSLAEPVKQFQGELVISVPWAIKQNIEKLVYRCTSYSYPTAEVSTTKVTIAGYEHYRAAFQKRSGTFTCKITEDMKGSVLKFINSWINLEHSYVVNYRSTSKSYIGEAVLKIAEGGREIELYGFYPVKYSVPPIDPSSSNPVDVTVDFNYDYWLEKGEKFNIKTVAGMVGIW